MKPIGATNLDLPARATAVAWRVRALQKANGTSDLRGEHREQPHREPLRPNHDARLDMRQSGTVRPVPLRDSGREYVPHLTAAFTAQLLGQILPDPERRSSAGAAYDREAVLLSLGFDTKL